MAEVSRVQYLIDSFNFFAFLSANGKILIFHPADEITISWPIVLCDLLLMLISLVFCPFSVFAVGFILDFSAGIGVLSSIAIVSSACPTMEVIIASAAYEGVIIRVA
jgi:hypothetical protein